MCHGVHDHAPRAGRPRIQRLIAITILNKHLSLPVFYSLAIDLPLIARWGSWFAPLQQDWHRNTIRAAGAGLWLEFERW